MTFLIKIIHQLTSPGRQMGVDTCRTWAVYPNSGLKQVDFSSPTSLYVPYLCPTYSELLSFAFGNQNVTEALPRWREASPDVSQAGPPVLGALVKNLGASPTDFFYSYRYITLCTILAKG